MEDRDTIIAPPLESLHMNQQAITSPIVASPRLSEHVSERDDGPFRRSIGTQKPSNQAIEHLRS